MCACVCVRACVYVCVCVCVFVCVSTVPEIYAFLNNKDNVDVGLVDESVT